MHATFFSCGEYIRRKGGTKMEASPPSSCVRTHNQKGTFPPFPSSLLYFPAPGSEQSFPFSGNQCGAKLGGNEDGGGGEGCPPHTHTQWHSQLLVRKRLGDRMWKRRPVRAYVWSKNGNLFSLRPRRAPLHCATMVTPNMVLRVHWACRPDGP